MKKFVLIVVAMVVLVLARMSCYTVDAAEYAYVTFLGRHQDTFDGGDPDQGAGLHFRWPWPIQTVVRLDRRLQYFDLPAMELMTHDPKGKTIDKTLSVEASVMWKIAGAGAVDRFILSMGTADRARSILAERITGQIGAVIGHGKIIMDDLISTQPGKNPGTTHVDDTMADLKDKLMDQLKQTVRDEYGIELVDIRLRRFNHPARVRDAIFDRIKSERGKKVADYRSDGEKKAKDIETRTEEEVRTMIAKARFEEEKIKGDADTLAIRIRNQAHSQDPEFYAFLKKLEKLDKILGDNKTVLLLSSHRAIFDLLFQPPRPGNVMPAPEKGNPKKGGSP